MKENTKPKKREFEFESKQPGFATNLTRERITQILAELTEGRSGASMEEMRAMALYWGSRWTQAKDDIMAARQAVGMFMVAAKMNESAIEAISEALGMEGTVVMKTGEGLAELFKQPRDN